MSFRDSLRHAFAVDPPGPAEPTPMQSEAIDALCRLIAKKKMYLPAQTALEMCRPLNYIGSQLMHVAAPLIGSLAKELTYERYVATSQFLEKRGSIEYVLNRLDAFERHGGKPAAPAAGDPVLDPAGDGGPSATPHSSASKTGDSDLEIAYRGPLPAAAQPRSLQFPPAEERDEGD